MEDTKAVDNNPLSQISAVKLEGTYLTWSSSCSLLIKFRKLFGYITGEKKTPDVIDAKYGQ